MLHAPHIPVLLHETLAALAPAPGDTFLDCTAGLGGHALEIARRVGPSGLVILNDLDPANLDRAAAAVRASGVPTLPILGNFAELPHALQARGLAADLLLADLGFASSQVDDPARGFSFSRDGPLDMRLNPASPTTAAHLVASLPEHELARIIRDFGEDRNARRIAAAIVRERALHPFLTTAQLADAVRRASPSHGPIHPATRTFQALRIAVNDELGALDALLGHLRVEAERLSRGLPPRWLRPGARIAFISFHSLEDRPVKHALADLKKSIPNCTLTGPVTPSDAELDANPRARSAKLRALALPRS